MLAIYLLNIKTGLRFLANPHNSGGPEATPKVPTTVLQSQMYQGFEVVLKKQVFLAFFYQYRINQKNIESFNRKYNMDTDSFLLYFHTL